MNKKSESDTALSFDSSGRLEFEITHPFHPDYGRQLRILHTRRADDVLWLWYSDREGKPRRVKQGFTDRAAPDAFRQQAAGRCAFRPADLVRLVDVVTRLMRRGAG
jgi:hypothetical protein